MANLPGKAGEAQAARRMAILQAQTADRSAQYGRDRPKTTGTVPYGTPGAPNAQEREKRAAYKYKSSDASGPGAWGAGAGDAFYDALNEYDFSEMTGAQMLEQTKKMYMEYEGSEGPHAPTKYTGTAKGAGQDPGKKYKWWLNRDAEGNWTGA